MHGGSKGRKTNVGYYQSEERVVNKEGKGGKRREKRRKLGGDF